ncbi:MAG: hypothetical protein MK135_13750, partial [Polyangiaceae bacterium]|nr:hypothetical protein [Polyangiaceae bacterium]
MQFSGRSTIVYRFLFCSFLAVGFLSCRGSRPPVRSPLAERPSSSEWLFHPDGTSRIIFRWQLDDERELQLDEAGNRWVLSSTGATKVAPHAAVEGLVYAAHVDQGFAFVGEAGTVYWSRSIDG